MKRIKKIFSRTINKIKFYFFYVNKISLKSKHKKEIIILFDGNYHHGGLVDRLKGIISFFQIAQKFEFDFKIYFKSPFDLTHFLSPNNYNWLATEKDLSWNPFSTKVLYLMDEFNFKPIDYFLLSKKKKYFIYCNIDYSRAIYRNIDDQTLQEYWRASFNSLFKKSDYLNSTINQLNLQSNRIAIHTRFTSLFGDFKDLGNNIASESRKNEIKISLAKVIQEISTKYPQNCIYIFSDSIEFLNFIKINSNYIILEGSPLHIDTNNKVNNYMVHLKTFVDFLVIAESDMIFFLKTEDMYNSAFSKYAAIIGNKSFSTINL